MALRPRHSTPRLLAVSLAMSAALSITAGWAIARVDDDDGVDAGDEVLLDEPGEYAQSADGLNTDNTGASFPAVTLVDASGADVPTASLLGRPLVVNLWYSTCPPCLREMPAFAEVHAEAGDEVRFVGVNPLDDASTMTSFAEERGVGYELLRDPASELVDALGVTAFPATVFVAADGSIVLETGVLTAAELRAHLEHVF